MFELQTTSDRLTAEVREGEVETVKELIEERGYSFKGWADNCFLLCSSLTFGNVDVAKYLLSTDLKVNERNPSSDCSPLHLAVELGHESVIKMLLEKCTDVNLKSRTKQITPLYGAVCRDNVRITELLLNFGSDVNSVDCNNGTPLHVACENGNEAIVNLLLQNGAYVNARTGTYRTPLHFAARKGDVNVMKSLLSRGALVNARTADALTSLHLAVETDCKDVVKCLLDSGADANAGSSMNGFPLDFAVKKENKEIVELLLSNGALVNPEPCIPTPLRAAVTPLHALTPLHAAVETGREEIMELLLSYGACIDACHKDKGTPLHIAAEKSRPNIVKLLLSKGAAVNIKTPYASERRTPLHIAVGSGNKDIVELLRSHGAEINSDTDNESPLHIAVSEGNKDIVRFLLKSGARVNGSFYFNWNSPIYVALKKGDTEMMELLLKKDDIAGSIVNRTKYNDIFVSALKMGYIDIVDLFLRSGAGVNNNVKDRDGQTVFGNNMFRDNFKFIFPLEIAAGNGKTNVVKLLLDRGADVNVVTMCGSALHAAAGAGCEEVVEILLQFGANVNAQTRIKHWPSTEERITERFYTPLYKAAENGHKNVVALLLSRGASVEAELGYAPVQIAAKRENWEIVKMLWRSDACVRSEHILNAILPYAIKHGNRAIIKSLLTLGASVDFESDWIIQFLDSFGKASEYSDEMGLCSGASTNYMDEERHIAHSFAAKSVDVEIVKLLLDRGAWINVSDAKHRTALSLAAKSGDKEIVELLLDRGADVNPHSGFYLPLQEAVEGGCRDIVEMLLRKGADINAVNFQNNTALCFACQSSNVEIVKLLLDKGADVNLHSKTHLPLQEAVKSGCRDIVEMLLNKGADINAVDFQNNTALCFACQSSNVEIVKLLLDRGAVVNLHSKFYLPLQEAVKSGCRDIVEMLLNKGADVNAVDFLSNTALCFACESGSKDIVELLLNCGASTDTGKPRSRTPLCIAVSRGDTDLVRLLLIKNACADGTSFEKDDLLFVTPLYVAINGGQVEITDLLLMNGADPHKLMSRSCASCEIGGFALLLAVKKNNAELVKVILKYYVNPMDEDIHEAFFSSLDFCCSKVTDAFFEHGYIVDLIRANNPVNLFAAFERGHLRAIEEILKACTDVQQLLCSKNKEGFMPLHSASKRKRRDIAQILIANGADVNATDKHGKAPIFYSVENCDYDMFITLLPYFENKQDLLFHVVHFKYLRFVTALLEHGVDINKCDKNDMSPLHLTLLPCKRPNQKWDMRNFRSFCHENFKPEILKEILSLLLSKGANVDVCTTHGETLLHYAAQYGSVDIVALLVEKNVKVNAADSDGFTPLHHSVRSKNVKMTKFLLKEGADVNSTTKEGMTPLHFACESGYAELVGLLVESVSLNDSELVVNARMKIGDTPLHYVAKNFVDFEIDRNDVDVSYDIDFYEVANILLRKGADVNAAVKPELSTPFHVAVERKKLSLVKLFLRHGVNINAKYKEGLTPLHVACKLLNVDLVQLLLKHSADVNAQDTHGRTPFDTVNVNLDYYDDLICYEILKLLLDFGATLASFSDGVSMKSKLKHPLLLAVKRKNAKCVELMLNHGCYVNTKIKHGKTLLHLACKESNGEVVEALLRCFAYVDAKDDKGNTPLYNICATKRDLSIVRSLLEHGADINCMCENGTALHLAALNNNVQIAKILIEYGADINTTNLQGITPLESAKAGRQSARSIVDSSKIRNEECFFYLLSHCIRMKAANAYVNERNLHYLKPEIFRQFYRSRARDYPQFPNLQSECENEILKLKGMKISDSVFSVYDIVKGNVNTLFKISTYDVSIMHSKFICRDFEFYADLITGNYHGAVQRRKLIERCRETGLFESLPDLCRVHIFSYLTNADLRMVINACLPVAT